MCAGPDNGDIDSAVLQTPIPKKTLSVCRLAVKSLTVAVMAGEPEKGKEEAFDIREKIPGLIPVTRWNEALEKRLLNYRVFPNEWAIRSIKATFN